MISVQLRSFKFQVDPEEIEKIATRLPPSKGRKYATFVGSRAFSPKELLVQLVTAKNIPLTRMDFTTMDAVRILRRLGFETHPIGTDRKPKKSLLSFAGIVSLGGDSLRESEAWYE